MKRMKEIGVKNYFLKHVIKGLFLFLLFSSLGFGQIVSLRDCLQRAREMSFNIAASTLEEKAANQQFLFEKSQLLPQFSTELAYDRHELLGYGYHQQWALLHSDWALGNLIYKPYQIHYQQILAARQKTRLRQLETLQRTAGLYIRILQKNKEYHLLKERLHLLSMHYNIAQALWQAGTKTELDLLQTRAEILKLKENLSAVAKQAKIMNNEMALLIGLTAVDSLHLVFLNTKDICRRPVPALDEVQLENNPMLKALQFRRQAMQLEIKAVRASQLPHLYLSAGFFVDHNPTGDGDYWLAGAGITFPLFRWNATKYQAQKAQIMSQSFNNQKLGAQRELHIHAMQALSALKNLKHMLNLQTQRMETVERAYQIAAANYRAGLITNLEYLNAQQQLTKTKIERQSTELEYVLRLVDYYVVTNQTEKIEAL